MGGIPGRSKACRTCRRRKKGCDLQKPTCSQCRKACIQCEGYKEGLEIFQYSVPNRHQQEPSSAKGSLVGSGSGKEIEHLSTAPGEGSFLSKSAYRSGLEAVFWSNYMPNGRSFPLFNDTIRALGGSISALQDLVPQSSLLKLGLGALALRSLAISNSASGWIEREALKLHTLALQETAKALAAPSKSKCIELIGTTRLLSFYEALYGGEIGNDMAHYLGWKAHHSGDLAITFSKDPSFFATGQAHRLFADGRFNHAVCAMRARKACPLSNPIWMTVPWTHHPKTSKDLLIDIVVELPGLCEGIDYLSSTMTTESSANIRKLLRKKAFDIIARMIGWRETFSKPTILLSPNLRPPENISSQDLADSHLMTFSWGISLLVYGQIFPLLDEPAEAAQLNPDECCSSIIHSIPLLLHPSVGIFRQHLVPFPVIAACVYLVETKSSNLRSEREILSSFFQRHDFAAMHPFMKTMSPQISQVLVG